MDVAISPFYVRLGVQRVSLRVGAHQLHAFTAWRSLTSLPHAGSTLLLLETRNACVVASLLSYRSRMGLFFHVDDPTLHKLRDGQENRKEDRERTNDNVEHERSLREVVR